MNEQGDMEVGLLSRLRLRKRKKGAPTTLREPPVHALKDALVVIILVLICVCAIVQEMEFLAIASLIILATVVYKQRSREALDIGYELLKRTRTAKVGDLEFTTERKLRDYSRLLSRQEEWIRIILSEMTAEQISLLLAVHRAQRYEARDKDALRALRARGLLHHNAPSMSASTEVWLSELGNEVASHLLEPKTQQDVLLALQILSAQEVKSRGTIPATEVYNTTPEQ